MAVKKSQLYSALWKSCDELRGGMDASQYKDYVLILLFIKYISDKAEADEDALEEIKLLDLVVKNKESVIEQLPKNIRKNKEAVAEVIENNVRRLIIDERHTNPKYYENMSTLLEELILERRQASIKYSNYIQKIAELIKKIKNPSSSRDYPKSINSNAKRALYDNFGSNEDFVLALHENIMEYKTDSWRGNKIKTKQLKNGIIKTIKKFKLEEEIDVSEALRLVGEQNEY